MKFFYSKFLTALLLLCFAFSAKAQTYNYIPFPDSNTTWKGYTIQCAMGSCWVNHHWTYRMSGDTTINNNSYHRINSDFYVREDSNKRVYIISEADSVTPEKLLYDFSLSVGDTISSPAFWIVRAIDTPSYNGVKRRTLHIGTVSSTRDKWIEGVGSLISPVWQREYNCCCCGWVNLCEVSQDSVLTYSTPSSNACSFFNDIKDELDDKILSIYPNPATDELTITTETNEPVDIAVYDMLGNELRSIQNSSANSIKVKVSDLPAGYYLLKLISSHGSSSIKGFIIAR